MPIFARRRLQSMINDVGTILSDEKRRDLVRRIESKRTDQALAGEAELAVLWATSRIGSIEPEPSWWGSSAPELLTDNLIEGSPVIIEVKGVSNGSMGDGSMRRAADKLAQIANQTSKNSGGHLHFHFAEESGYGSQGYVRRRKVSENYAVSPGVRDQLRNWIMFGKDRAEKARLCDENIDVVVSWRKRATKRPTIFCTMPPECYSLTKNPIAQALQHARRQLRNPAFDGSRIIVLFDTGCDLLHNLQSYDGSQRRLCGEEIIREFMRRSRKEAPTDVAVISTTRGYPDYRYDSLSWNLTVYGAHGNRLDSHPLERVVELLPQPRLEGYQVRSAHMQGQLQLSAQHYGSATSYHWDRERTLIKVSTRALLEFLSGRIDENAFRNATGLKLDRNVMRAQLDKQRLISRVEMEDGELDRDDDFLVFEFAGDPAVKPLEVGNLNERS